MQPADPETVISPEHYGLVELGFVFLVGLGIAVYELVSVKRSIRESRERKAAEEQAAAAAESKNQDTTAT